MMEIALKWMPAIVLLVQVLMAWAMWSLAQKFVSRDSYDEDKKDKDNRLRELERSAAAEHTRSQYDVTTGDLEKIYDRINDVDRKVSSQSGELRSIRSNLSLIQQHLLEK